MYKPPERIPHSTSPGRWPNRKEAEQSQLFQPIDVGPVTLAERTWVPAMVPWRATEEGFVSPEVLAWYGRFARGKPGAIVVEATGIRDIPSGPLLRIGNDDFIPGLSDLVQTVRQNSDGRSRLFIQLIDFLSIKRRPKPDVFFDRYLKVTQRHKDLLDLADADEDQVRDQLKRMSSEQLAQVLEPREMESLQMGYRERVTDTHLPHIRDLPKVLPQLFADAAVRAKKAGFDGVELHYAHAYTMASFLSALNTRDDGYGGSRELRVRLPLEVYSAVRKAVGTDFAVGCRFLTEDCIPGGNTARDAEYFGAEFARAGMDFLSTSRGGKFEDAQAPKIGWAAYPYTGLSGYECMPHHLSDDFGPFERNVEPTARVRKAVRDAGLSTPVVVTGGIYSFAQAERILESEDADVIGAARQTLADPDWFLKTRLGRGNEIHQCEYTNYCEGLDQKHKQVTCKLWDRKNLDEPGVLLSRDGKRRLVAPD